MAPIKFSRIISVSTEDAKHPASNLLKDEPSSGCSWKCKDPGEQQAIVIFQLQQSAVIHGVDIGNENSAFVEVLVARSAVPDDYQVLIVASALMTVQEARNGVNKNGVRFFKYENLAKPAADESWDRIKIVCSQPFNPRSQYGLSFVKLYPKCEKPSQKSNQEVTMKLGKFSLKDDSSFNSLAPGTLFATRNDKVEPPTAAAAIRDASAILTAGILSNKRNSTGGKSSTPKPSSPDSQPPAKKQRNAGKVDTGRKSTSGPLLYTEEDEEEVGQKSFSQTADTSDKRKSVVSARSSKPASTSKASSPKRKPFNKLLEGVTFVISGYQNPYRSELRSKALEMGAKYKADWDSSCTHLICAFANTPKYNQVLGKGRIVKKDWIEDSYRERKRLSWKKYVFDKSMIDNAESDEEVWEECQNIDNSGRQQEKKPNLFKNLKSKPLSSGSDTEDEIERVKQRQSLSGSSKVKNRAKTSKDVYNSSKVTNSAKAPQDIYEMDTDVENVIDEDMGSENPKLDSGEGCSKNGIPFLPEFFEKLKFHLHPSIPEDVRKCLRRYIIAYKGSVVDNQNDADYVVSERLEDVKRGITVVKPEWIWDCNDSSTMVPVYPYLLRQSGETWLNASYDKFLATFK